VRTIDLVNSLASDLFELNVVVCPRKNCGQQRGKPDRAPALLGLVGEGFPRVRSPHFCVDKPEKRVSVEMELQFWKLRAKRGSNCQYSVYHDHTTCQIATGFRSGTDSKWLK